ncbi:TetR family transcriptional regulator [Roseibium aquae]|uniref:TetR family transcriptional regulator n=1 Tax=Roseibium aquae TaxID=1323746 RepID=A0A916WZR1_9HYPH|nr:TetR family transcriptional regulator [Roseibium aquae]
MEQGTGGTFSASQRAILEAALSIVCRSGGMNLTIDAVAAQSGFSKGGVLYNFKSKNLLICGMVRYLTHQFDAEVALARLRHQDTDSPTLSAMIDVTERWLNEQQTVSRAVLVTSVQTPSLIEPFVDLMQGYRTQIAAESADFTRAMVVLSALDGLHFCDAHGVSLMSQDERRAVLNWMRNLLKPKD